MAPLQTGRAAARVSLVDQHGTPRVTGQRFAVTEFGKKWLAEASGFEAIPSEFGRFGQLLASHAQRFGAGFHARAQEALACYRVHTYLACCAMCGAAAESILLALAIAKQCSEEEVLRKYNTARGRSELEKMLMARQNSHVQKELPNSLGLLSHWRDSASHGLSSTISEEDAFVAILLLLRFAWFAEDPRGVRDMIALLSDLLRYALKGSTEQEIQLYEELRLLRIYLEILETRYEGQLRTIIDVDKEARAALVPNLILQPVVENAVKHGIDRAGGHGRIEVRACRSGDNLVLTVRDTGFGEEAGVPGEGGNGVGLRLTRDRLAELYGIEQCLELSPVPGGGMTARIVLPYHTRDDVRIAEELVYVEER